MNSLFQPGMNLIINAMAAYCRKLGKCGKYKENKQKDHYNVIITVVFLSRVMVCFFSMNVYAHLTNSGEYTLCMVQHPDIKIFHIPGYLGGSVS